MKNKYDQFEVPERPVIPMQKNFGAEYIKQAVDRIPDGMTVSVDGNVISGLIGLFIDYANNNADIKFEFRKRDE
jgi:hypothetical protein